MYVHHTSDWHIGKSPSEARNARQLVKGLSLRPGIEHDVLVISGDVTEDGQAKQWQEVEEILAPLYGKLPHLIVPGNHDCGLHGITYELGRVTRTRNAIRKLSPLPDLDVAGLLVWQIGAWRFVGLDSQRGNEDSFLPPLARGEIGAAQLAALEVVLHDDIPTLVILHHHPIWPEPAHVLTDAAQLKQILGRRACVRGVLYGHQHVEALVCDEGGCQWLASGKTTDLVDGRISWRTYELETGRVQTCTIPAP